MESQETARKILIADDDPSMRALLKLYLKNSNAEVLEAANGIEALRIMGFSAEVVAALKGADQIRILDLITVERDAICKATAELWGIITDCEMPKMNGAELSHIIQSIQGLDLWQGKAVMLTSIDKERADKLGIRIPLHPKPISRTTMEAILQDLNAKATPLADSQSPEASPPAMDAA